jgi:branched-chain amino acid transport system ATP-binding protein
LERNNSTLLEVSDLTVSYGNNVAVRNINLKVEEGEIVALIGANGSGKSTVLRSILGLQRPDRGSILFMGKDISRVSVDEIVSSGIAFVPEGRGVLNEMTVMENLEMGAYHRKGDIYSSKEKIFQLFPILLERRQQKAGLLSGGQQQMLAIGRALMAEPALIMMDEPSLGLAPIIIDQLFKIIADIKREGHTLLLSEQNARKALQVADRGYVFERGCIVLEGSSQWLREHDLVRKAYLGG